MRPQVTRRKVPWIIGGAVSVAAIVVVLLFAWFLTPRGDAEDHALAYLQALADGDVAAVQATGVDVPATAVSAFAAASGHLSEGAIEASTADDHTAVVTVSFELAGVRHESTLTLSQRDGRWVPDAASALGSVRFTLPASVDETVLPQKNAVMLPAVYDLVSAPTEFLDGSGTIEVVPGRTQTVDIDASLRPEATRTAQSQLDEYLLACTEPAAEALSSCGITIPWASDLAALSEIRYRIEQTPTISLTPSAFHADGGVLIATVTGTAFDGSKKTLTYRSANWTVRGDVTFTHDDIELSVW